MSTYSNPTDALPLPQDDLALRKFLIYSLILHAGLVALCIGAAIFHWNSNEWSGTGSLGDSQSVNLVTSAGLPLPKPAVVSESETADPSKTLYKMEQPKLPEPKTQEVPIPKFDKEHPLPPTPKSRVFENKQPPPPNAVPGRGHGVPDIPSGVEQTPGRGTGGVASNQQAGGLFASRYPWYIAAAKRRVEPNWTRLDIDAAVRYSQTLHSVIGFTISRDGSIRNLRIVQSSGNQSWDNSGIRAIQSSTPFPPLPSDWTAPDVDVLWDFPDRNGP